MSVRPSPATARGTSVDDAGRIINTAPQDNVLTVNNSADYTYNGTLERTVALTKTGAGTLILGNADNSHVGATTVAGGVLQIASVANGGANSSIGAATNAAANLVLNGGTLRYVGTTPGSTDRLFTLGDAGGTIESSSATPANALSFTNTGAIAHTGAANAARMLVLSGSNTGNNTVAAAIGDNGAGAVSLTKQGAGVWILSGVSTYSGVTTVAQGTLSITGSGSISNSTTIDVQSGATFNVAGVSGGYILAAGQTLKGNGTIQGNATINGTLAPGASPGKLTAGTGSAVTFALNSTFLPEVGKSIAGSLPSPGTDYDQLALANGTTTTIASGAILRVLDLPNVEVGDVYTILDNTGTGTLIGTGNFVDGNNGNVQLAEGSSVLGSTGNQYTISYQSNDVTLTATSVVPEPATVSLLGLGAIGLLARRRRRALRASKES